MNERIYVVEDEVDIRELIQYNLTKAGYLVETFANAESMLLTLQNNRVDLILLDVMLPGINGIEACVDIRAIEEHQDTPIIMLTAKGEETDIVKGLDSGADDYIVKPFSPKVLIARIKAILRRKKVESSLEQQPLVSNEITIHPGRHEVTVEGQKVELTSSEFSALYLMVQKPGWVFTRYQIVEEVHGPNYPVTDRSVDVMIAGLRKKLGDHGKKIQTVRGIGYKYIGDENV